MQDSIFTKIIKGEIPAHKVFEDDKTIAIIPLHPIAKAHVLVIPKVQVDQFIDLDPTDYQALWQTVQRTGHVIRDRVQPKRVGLQVVGLDVPHVHVHVVGFDTLEEYRQLPDQSLPPDTEKQKQLAKILTFS